jgi:hypothetical protein
MKGVSVMQRSLSRGGFAAIVVSLSLLLVNSGLALDKNSEAMKKMVERGSHLVWSIGCNDCHSPKLFGPKGPYVDSSRVLSGSHLQSVPEIPAGVLGPKAWGALAANDFTAWAGPWGVSFTANLTPDVKTGIGSWTEDMFVKTIRNGKHMGEGRNLLPPMPWDVYRNLSDEDLKSIFAYLKTIKPIENAVHEPIPPPEQPKH